MLVGWLTGSAMGLCLYLLEEVVQQQQQQQPFNGLWSGTTRVGRYQKKHSPTHTHSDHQTSFIIFLHLQRSMASSLFILRPWQSSRPTSLQVLFGLPLGLGILIPYEYSGRVKTLFLFCWCVCTVQILEAIAKYEYWTPCCYRDCLNFSNKLTWFCGFVTVIFLQT